MKDCKWFKCFFNSFSLLANIATAGAFVFALIQYSKFDKSQRTERSLQLNHSYFNSEIIQARKNLILGSKQISDIEQIRGSTSNTKLADKLISKYLLKWARSQEREWLVAYGYYAMAYSCIEKKLCSPEDVSPLIESDGYKFFELFMHYSCEYLSKKTDQKDIKYFESVQSFYLKASVNCNFPSYY